MSNVVEVTDQLLKEFLGGDGVFVLDCWAEWCGPCKMISPIINELSMEYDGRVVFGKLNIDENPKTPGEYGINAIPTLLIFNDGILVDRIVGLVPKQRIKDKLNDLIG